MQNIGLEDLKKDESLIAHFLNLDDDDIRVCIKMWRNSDDKILSRLCKMLHERKLFRTELRDRPFEEEFSEKIRQKIEKEFGLSAGEGHYFLATGSLNNSIYVSGPDEIPILRKEGSTAMSHESLNTKNR